MILQEKQQRSVQASMRSHGLAGHNSNSMETWEGGGLSFGGGGGGVEQEKVDHQSVSAEHKKGIGYERISTLFTKLIPRRDRSSGRPALYLILLNHLPIQLRDEEKRTGTPSIPAFSYIAASQSFADDQAELILARSLATMVPKNSSLWRSVRSYQIYGANTNVGKTIMSTILCRAFARRSPDEMVWYLKPVSTGPLHDADDRHLTRFSPETQTHCLFQFDEAVSPHIAARLSKQQPPSDSHIQEQVLSYLRACAQSGPGTLLLETAGGVHSPTPSGSSQADLYRPLRLPVCLVADHRLGGISSSISAFESLHIRGYDLHAVLVFEDSKYQNHTYLKSYFDKKDVLSLSIPPPPAQGRTQEEDYELLAEYYDKMSKLDAVDQAISTLAEKHISRIQKLEGMSSRAHNQIWYPFTQHREVSPQTIMSIDSASGDFFQTHSICPASSGGEDVLTPTFDGSASWWTQGLGHGNPELSLEAGYAAGRYGHVMFAGTIHEPALLLAETLLRNLNNPRLSRVFYSDNGSTGMEVATKMALTASCERSGWEERKTEVGVLGLKGSYHGDTIGAMDCSEPSTFNEKVHWYKGRGYWFDFPRVKLRRGRWCVEPPTGMEAEFGSTVTFGSLAEIFDLETRLSSPCGRKYQQHIKQTLERLVHEQGLLFGALIMEPVILGAGGMLFADPLFQHTLVQVVRNSSQLFGGPEIPAPQRPQAWAGLPVVFDEVFTGLYRLGRFSSASFLQVHPDISVHAKLLTGGLIPLCTTLASESIYNVFLGAEKRDALLHGHSYTAHPVGCHVANTSLRAMLDMEKDGKWQSLRSDWQDGIAQSGGKPAGKTGPAYTSADIWSAWSKDFAIRVSHSPDVESVIALGSVLAINLQDENAGYSSTAASGLQKKLLNIHSDFNIHVRVLGNVIYLMASQTSKCETLRIIEERLLAALI
ncbi:onanonoxo-7-onima-8-eninoihtemlysoneda [Diplocarpon mali]|nr:onanonoxo-7-onima-8-eninoihtemlysoneda [Diplocarpon mali]